MSALKACPHQLTYAKQIFEVLCVLRAPRECPDATCVLLETGQERDLLLGLTWVRIEIIKCFKSLSPSSTYAKQIFEVLCVLRAPRESPDATCVLLETGQERYLLLGLIWGRIEIIECFKSLSPSTDLCQTDF